MHCGDTVMVPAGSATWTVQVTVKPPKGCSSYQGVTLQGKTVCNGTPGVQVTSCTDNTNITLSYSNTGLYIGPCSTSSFCTLTGFTFIAGVTASNGAIDVVGTHGQVSFRLHHYHFKNSLSGGVLTFALDGYGLIDHYLVDDTNSSDPATPVNVGGDFPTRGYLNWNDPSNFGSNEAVYIEDSESNSLIANAEGFYDGYYGCKIVVRYTTINGNQLGGGHGTDSGSERGCVSAEFYDDTLTNNTSKRYPVFNTRSGTYLFFNNVVKGSTGYSNIDLQYYRISSKTPQEASTWGIAGPGLNWTPISTTETSALSDINTLNAPDWQPNHAYGAGAAVGPRSNNAGQGSGAGGYNFQNKGACTSGGGIPSWTQTVGGTTSDGNCVWMNVGGGTTASASLGIAGFCAANPDTLAATNLICSGLLSGDTASRYFDANGGVYPYRDQPGRVHNQVLAPNYNWNNSGSALPNPVMMTDSSTSSIIQEGRDYYNNTQMPGYTAYTYPHPLQTMGTQVQAPAAPTGLIAVVQ
ncbi:MAG TPA: hypothetical protein VMH00_10505 [Candidatus Limnocylindrales bacterium]|nr:hypothetical protein [Candidatus Limnocylindrales bacterium]